MDRREFIKSTGALAIAGVGHNLLAGVGADDSPPSYLQEFAKLYRRNPRSAALAWFAQAKFGLFMHYGIYSLLGRGEWVLFRENIPLGEYEKLKDRFTAANFDADFVTDLALSAGMTYVNITARHHDSFCLFESAHSNYSSTESPARRDLIGELAEQCRKKSLGLFLYYSYALDWRHPYFYPRRYNTMARPLYDPPEPRYLFKKDEDFRHYLDFVHGQLTELLTNYGPLAGIWFDPIMGYYARPDLFPIAQTYALVRRLQPQTLISFKQGASGDEDFAAPERRGHSLAEHVKRRFGPEKAAVAEAAWEKNKNKHNEICDTMQPGIWGYRADDDGKHDTPDKVMQKLSAAKEKKCNLLLNTGPLPDGEIHPEDIKTLREVGQRLSMEQ